MNEITMDLQTYFLDRAGTLAARHGFTFSDTCQRQLQEFIEDRIEAVPNYVSLSSEELVSEFAAAFADIFVLSMMVKARYIEDTSELDEDIFLGTKREFASAWPCRSLNYE